MLVPVEYWPHITAGLIFISILLLATGWLQYVRFQKQHQEMLQKIRYAGHMPSDGQVDFNQATRKGDSKLSGMLASLGKRVAGNKVMDPMDTRIRFLRAGLRGEKAPAVFWGVKIILAILAPLLLFLSHIVAPVLVISPINMVIALAIPALIGFYLPDLWLYNKGLHRKEDILDSFPDALDLLVVCVEAGMGLDAAIQRVSKEIEVDSPTLSEELTLFSLEMRGGMLRRDALKNLAIRTNLVEIDRLTTLLIQTDRFGTSVGNALKVFSDTLRVQRYQRAEELAGKIPVKLLFPLIFFIFPSLFVVILGPAVIRMYQTFIMK